MIRKAQTLKYNKPRAVPELHDYEYRQYARTKSFLYCRSGSHRTKWSSDIAEEEVVLRFHA